MKNITTLTVSAGLALLLAGCGTAPSTPEKPAAKASDAYALDVAVVCNAEKLGAQAVLDQAHTFNPIAKKMHLEFRRHGMDNNVLITETQAAIDAKATEVKLLDDRKQKDADKKLKEQNKSAKDLTPEEFAAYKKSFTTKVSLSVNDAASRACKFAIRALQQDHESQEEYKLAVPGMGYTY